MPFGDGVEAPHIPTSRKLVSSFRDPSGKVVLYGGRILRIVNQSGMDDLNAFLNSSSGRKLMDEGVVIGTRLLKEPEIRTLLADQSFAELTAGSEVVNTLEHERIWFPSYPYEWPAEMLYAAGELTLTLALRLLRDNLGLKDGTPYNVLFRGPRPVFVDVLSFERRDPGDSIWLPYAQFVRTFLLPLLVAKRFGMAPGHTLLTRRDGLEPEEVYKWLGPLQKFSPAFLSLVSMPSWLASKYESKSATIHQAHKSADPEKAKFILEHLLKSTARKLHSANPRPGTKSQWAEYMVSNNNYSKDHFAAKETFVCSVMNEFHPGRVLDVGCNTGHFSEIAARSGAEVVALDYDAVVLGDVWRRASTSALNILPLHVNLCRPTPGTGWWNEECPAFLDRARGAFDCILMLAVIHHMLVTERVPLPKIIDMAAEITRDMVIVEFVGPEDSMFRRIARGRDHLHTGLTVEVFEKECKRRFDIARTQHLPDTHRRLYLLRRKPD